MAFVTAMLAKQNNITVPAETTTPSQFKRQRLKNKIDGGGHTTIWESTANNHTTTSILGNGHYVSAPTPMPLISNCHHINRPTRYGQIAAVGVGAYNGDMLGKDDECGIEWARWNMILAGWASDESGIELVTAAQYAAGSVFVPASAWFGAIFVLNGERLLPGHTHSSLDCTLPGRLRNTLSPLSESLTVSACTSFAFVIRYNPRFAIFDVAQARHWHTVPTGVC